MFLRLGVPRNANTETIQMFCPGFQLFPDALTSFDYAEGKPKSLVSLFAFGLKVFYCRLSNTIIPLFFRLRMVIQKFFCVLIQLSGSHCDGLK